MIHHLLTYLLAVSGSPQSGLSSNVNVWGLNSAGRGDGARRRPRPIPTVCIYTLGVPLVITALIACFIYTTSERQKYALEVLFIFLI